MSDIRGCAGSVRHYIAMKKVTAILALLLASGSLVSCLRYTPSRQELEEKYEGTLPVEGRMGGELEFTEYEASLEARLDDFLAQRAHLLHSSPQAGYSVGPGDLVEVDVYGFEDLHAAGEVSPQGTLALPLVGEARVQGKSVDQIKRELRSRYSRFIRSPSIDVSLKDYHSSRVSVIGEVAKPGVYPLRFPGQLLTEFLSEAGGRTQGAGGRIIILPAPRILNDNTPYQANSPSVRLASTGAEGPQAGVEVDVERLVGQGGQPPLLIPMQRGDTVVVPEAGMYEVDGEVQKPGSYRLASRTSVIGAVAAAAGFTYSANVHEVEVIREIGGGRKAAITLDLEEIGLRGARDVRLRNGDLVRVPSEPGRFFRRQVVETLNGLFNGLSVNQRVN